MLNGGTPDLLHLVGYLTSGLLYAMLLAMAGRQEGTRDRLTISTAVLGLTWSLGELIVRLAGPAGVPVAGAWITAFSYGALGLLAAAVVHSASRGRSGDHHPEVERPARRIATLGYVCAGVSASMQLGAAWMGLPVPWSPALIVLTAGLAVLASVLVLTTRGHAHARRSMWMSALALFTVSALHLIGSHAAADSAEPESWLTELLGHHASIPLAFAILYQDYRFALADLFLKRALTLVVLVTITFATWSALVPTGTVPAHTVGWLLAAWVSTALLAPSLQRALSAFVDRVILRRVDYSRFLNDLAASLEHRDTTHGVLEHACMQVSSALDAGTVSWREGAVPTGLDEARVPTAEPPHYVISVRRLAGGRRLLSDDRTMLERVGHVTARRIDALRLSDERYERELQEREMTALAAQAELRALRAQINPHFLFNALTTVGYLIQTAPPRAFDTLMRLTTILRGVLRSDGDFTTLGHERDLIENYLAIERARFEERLDVRVDVPQDLLELPVPSLILQPLVENAVKHGIAKARLGGAVSVTAEWDHAHPSPRLRVAVRNTGARLDASAASGDGIGLDNVRRRLARHFGGEASLRLTAEGDGSTLAEILLPVPDMDSVTNASIAAGARR